MKHTIILAALAALIACSKAKYSDKTVEDDRLAIEDPVFAEEMAIADISSSEVVTIDDDVFEELAKTYSVQKVGEENLGIIGALKRAIRRVRGIEEVPTTPRMSVEVQAAPVQARIFETSKILATPKASFKAPDGPVSSIRYLDLEDSVPLKIANSEKEAKGALKAFTEKRAEGEFTEASFANYEGKFEAYKQALVAVKKVQKKLDSNLEVVAYKKLARQKSILDNMEQTEKVKAEKAKVQQKMKAVLESDQDQLRFELEEDLAEKVARGRLLENLDAALVNLKTSVDNLKHIEKNQRVDLPSPTPVRGD